MHLAPPPPPDLDAVLRVGQALLPLSAWHRHRVRGLAHIPQEGPWILVTNHSLATYDGFLLGREVLRHGRRVVRGLGDKRIFQVPGLRDFALSLGLVEANPGAAEALLARGEPVGVAPGGMWEALRPSSARATVRWDGRKGFVRLALRAGAPLVLAACPAADALYTVYGNPLTDALYARAHLPLPVARGWGPTLLPRPVRLTHHIAPPLVPPPWDPAQEDAQVDALHARACTVMAELLSRGD